MPVDLFVEARRSENCGQFGEAILTYENALNKVRKDRFKSNELKNRIIDKLRVLNILIEYKNNFHFNGNSQK